jgi:hypothetical protein
VAGGIVVAPIVLHCGVSSPEAGEPPQAERFEVPPALQAEFDAWLNGPYLDAVESWPGLVRVRTWRQLRDEMPQRFPYHRYTGKGNRMIWSDFEEGVDVRELLADRAVRADGADRSGGGPAPGADARVGRTTGGPPGEPHAPCSWITQTPGPTWRSGNAPTH